MYTVQYLAIYVQSYNETLRLYIFIGVLAQMKIYVIHLHTKRLCCFYFAHDYPGYSRNYLLLFNIII